ncbi:MAG TPA: tetratricopeptide repeat protein [Vicinamibacteria bacterium]|nr:tetratricopeptide repeat protein [Vicinamibacteria bacterium]
MTPVSMLRPLAVLLVALLAAYGGAVAEDLPDADALFAQAVARHQAGDVIGAIEYYEAALQKDPARVDARSNLGAAYARLGRYDEAADHYRRALAQEPEQTPVRFNLALSLFKSARVGEAASELEQVVARDPGNKAAALLLADCQLQLGRDAAVIELLGPREEQLKDDRLFVYLMGTALLRANDLQRGQVYVDRLFREGDPAEAHLLMGAMHLRKNDYRSAVPELEIAAVRNAELPAVHSLLGRALMGIGRRDEAKAAFERELARNPNDFDSNLYLGLFLKDEGRLDEAQEHLKRAGRLRSQDPAVLYVLGSLHLAAGRAEEARQALEKVTARAPNYRQAHVLLATAYYRLKDQAQGDRHRDIAEKLRAEEQAREPGPVDELAPAYQAGPAAARPQS